MPATRARSLAKVWQPIQTVPGVFVETDRVLRFLMLMPAHSILPLPKQMQREVLHFTALRKYRRALLIIGLPYSIQPIDGIAPHTICNSGGYIV